MGELQPIVDSTYRWGMVAVMSVMLAACFLPSAYRLGFPKHSPLYGIGSGLVLIGAGLAFALMFRESIVDALLLRARFGFMVPDTGVHGYGWALVFGYSLVFASALTLLIGSIMLTFGKVPPWISNNNERSTK
jgi:hypothetical protein